MNLENKDKLYLINSRIKSLESRKGLMGTEDDTGETLENLEKRIEALTNLLKMI